MEGRDGCFSPGCDERDHLGGSAEVVRALTIHGRAI
jgi:hypothetical protein